MVRSAWKMAPERKQFSQEEKNVGDKSPYFCLGRCAVESYWKS